MLRKMLLLAMGLLVACLAHGDESEQRILQYPEPVLLGEHCGVSFAPHSVKMPRLKFRPGKGSLSEEMVPHIEGFYDVPGLNINFHPRQGAPSTRVWFVYTPLLQSPVTLLAGSRTYVSSLVPAQHRDTRTPMNSDSITFDDYDTEFVRIEFFEETDIPGQRKEIGAVVVSRQQLLDSIAAKRGVLRGE